MPEYFGIIFALIALFAWGFGDFLIQRTTRLVGDWKALFYITLVGFVGLFSFIKAQISALTIYDIMLLSIIGIVSFLASLADFEALKKGKISIIEPVFGLELPFIIAASIIFVKERPEAIQLALMALIFIGILLAITRCRFARNEYRFLFEKGTLLAVAGSIGIAATAVLVGISSRTLSPLTIIWFADGLIMVFSAFYLIKMGSFRHFWKDLHTHPVPIIGQSVLDNVAWVSFGFATSIIPISITSAISESYIILAVLLGILINREKLRTHQKIGILLAIVSVILLSTVS